MLTERQIWDKIFSGKICPYCGNNTVFTDSIEVYGRSYGMMYICRPCHAYCGVHKDSRRSLGSVADGVTRDYRRAAHLYFDGIWKSERMSRNELYKWLSVKMNIPNEFTHIGMFNKDECENLIIHIKEHFNIEGLIQVKTRQVKSYPEDLF